MAGNIPPGLAKYIAEKKAGKAKPSGNSAAKKAAMSKRLANTSSGPAPGEGPNVPAAVQLPGL